MQIYADYFRRVREMAATGLVDCLAHLDLDQDSRASAEGRDRNLVAETLDLIAARGLAIELSTAGWRKPVNELYPSDAIIGWQSRKGFRSRPHPTRIHTYSLARITSALRKRCSSSAFAKSVCSKSTDGAIRFTSSGGLDRRIACRAAAEKIDATGQ